MDYEGRDYQHDVNRLYEQINATKTLVVNKQYVDSFVSYLRAKGSASATIAKHLNGLKPGSRTENNMVDELAVKFLKPWFG